MNSIFGFAVGLLQAALSLLGFVQQHPELPQASKDQAQIVAQQAITQATNALASKQTTTTAVQLSIDPIAAVSVQKFSGTAYGVSKVGVGFVVSAPASFTGGKSHGSAIVDVVNGHWSYIPPANFFEAGVYSIDVNPMGYPIPSMYTQTAKFEISSSGSISPVSQSGSTSGITAHIDTNSLANWLISNPIDKVISGNATGVQSLVIGVVRSGKPADQWNTAFASDTVVAADGRWSIVVPANKISCGTFDVFVDASSGTRLATGAFVATGCANGY